MRSLQFPIIFDDGRYFRCYDMSIYGMKCMYRFSDEQNFSHRNFLLDTRIA